MIAVLLGRRVAPVARAPRFASVGEMAVQLFGVDVVPMPRVPTHRGVLAGRPYVSTDVTCRVPRRRAEMIASLADLIWPNPCHARVNRHEQRAYARRWRRLCRRLLDLVQQGTPEPDSAGHPAVNVDLVRRTLRAR